MAVTIKDVAEKAGVSIATVSRVINNAKNVNPKLKKKVLDAISELKYEPNQLARGLKSNITKTIGIIVSDISNPFFMNIAKEVENKVKEKGYTLVMGSTDDDPDKEYVYIKLLQEKRVDGIIVSSTGMNEKYLFDLSNSGLPVVLIDRRPVDNKIDSVYVDKIYATVEIINHLFERGHKNIALVTGPNNIVTNFDRYIGYSKAFFNRNYKFNNNYIKFGEFTVEFGQQALKELVKLEPKPTAIISGSSIITKGILIEAQKMGITIPEDISLVSFGNIDMHELISPKLTYVEEMNDIIGQKGAEILLKKIKKADKNTEEIKLKPNLVIGESVSNILQKNKE